MSLNDIAEAGRLAAETAAAAGFLIMARRQAAYKVSRKADDSPVTEIDRLAEDLILKELTGHWPGVPVVSEESAAAGALPAVGDTYWLADPLDGTRGFVDGGGEFTVNIAFIINGRPACGAVATPAENAVHWSDGIRSYRSPADDINNREPIRVRKRPAAGLTVFASRTNLNRRMRELLEQLPVRETVRAGAAWKFCRLAEGGGDLYPRLSPSCLWDIAAGEAVLRGAGGLMADLQGDEISYSLPARPAMDDLYSPDFMAAGEAECLRACLAAADAGQPEPEKEIRK